MQGFQVQPIAQPITMPEVFKGVYGGKIFIGEYGKPAYENQIPITGVDVQTGEVYSIHKQPILINSGGFPVYNGKIIHITTDGAYSIAIYSNSDDEYTNPIWFRDKQKGSVVEGVLPWKEGETNEPYQLRFYKPIDAQGNPSGPSYLVYSKSAVIMGVKPDKNFKLSTKIEPYDNNADLINSGNDWEVLSAIGAEVESLGYYEPGQGGGIKGIVKAGPHTEDGGHIFTVGPDFYIENTFTNEVDVKKFGIIPNDTADNLARWEAFFAFYSTLTYSTAAVPNTANYPKIVGFGGKTYLSAPLEPQGAYFFGSLGGVEFHRHASWNQPAETFLLKFPNIYGADFGGLMAVDEDYFCEFSNNNLDVTQVKISGISSKKGDWVYKFNLKSAIVELEGYRFNQSLTSLHIDRCDKFYLGKGVIRQGVFTEDQSCSIQVDNAVFIAKDGAIGIPENINSTSGVKELAWINLGRPGINNTGSADIEKFRFGGEGGSMTAINSWVVPDNQYPIVPSSIIFSDNDAYSTNKNGGLDSCIIRLFAVPNQVILKNTRGMVDTDNIIAWGEGVNQNNALAAINGLKQTKYEFSGNVTNDFYSRLAPENIRALFETSESIRSELITRTGDNTIKILYGIIPLYKKIKFTVSLVPSTASQAYRSTVTGEILTKVGFSGGSVVQRMELANVHVAKGGSSFTNDLTVTPMYLTEQGSALSEVPDTDNTSKLRLDISGITGAQSSIVSESLTFEVLK